MNKTNQEKNLALFIDFDNIALGLRASRRKRFDVRLVLGRLLEKGKIIVKKAYADWSHFSEYKDKLHAAGIELIDIPKRKMTGKNSADIRMVVDAMDLCYTKEHLDTFVVLSGDSDFSPLVSKLRENNKSVIGMGVRKSTSDLLVDNCDEFIFYDDLARGRDSASAPALSSVPAAKAEVFKFLVSTVEALIRENKEVLYSSLIKDTMKRKQPSFTEQSYGYSTFGDLLEDAQKNGIIEITRDPKAGGTFIVTKLGGGAKRK
ncbi:NYN domain-containing protein [Candidatus Zixiibacteriota bacterium]